MDAVTRDRIWYFAARAFWLFVVCSVGGLLAEVAFHLAVFHEWQDRAGLLFGPFSPLYGVGGCAMAGVARLLEGRPLPVAFVAFAITGGVVEFATSWLMETVFGIVAWDYTGSFLSIDGRTNGPFMLAWGLLGVVLVRWGLPLMRARLFPLVERIPSLATAAFMAFMAVDVALTLVAFNCWFHRLDGDPVATRVQAVCAEVFDDAYMAGRFESMSITPQLAAR